jgi:hypothetical protein
MKLHGIGIRTLAVAALGLTLTGCGGSAAPSTAQNTSSEAGPSSASSQASPTTTSAATVVNEGIETEAAQSVAIFLDSLRKGDERAANGVLTSKAREELAKTSYEMQPLGTPEGQYRIGRVLFPYPEKSIALVECTWNEPPSSGEPEMEIVCEVHQEPEGWRISGIGVSVPGMEQALVLDFENASSLQATIDAATGQTSPSAAGQQPADQLPGSQIPAGQLTSQQPAGLPAYPGDGSTQLPATNADLQQIALPPLNGAPINR